jgi:flagellar motor switch protein FliN/FliY
MEESISSFFEQWTEEFARAVEMFTGERPALSHKPADEAQTEEWEGKRAEFHWWQQETEGPQKFKVWIGAEEACWSALGGGEAGDGNDPKELYQETLGQANQGTAAVLSSSFPTPVRFGNGSVDAPPALASLRLAEINVVFRDKPLPALILALEPGAAQILDGPESAKPSADSEQSPASGIPPAQAPPMLDRLLDLQLPVSILLGQTVLPIREALKITSGSLIELDRQLGDYVEVVIHGTVVARGEIVAVRGNYGVRIKEVISRKDRLALRDAA